MDSDGTPYLYLSTTRRCPVPPTPGAVCEPGRAISVLELSPDLLTAAGPRQPLFEGDPSTWELAANFQPPAPVVENPWPVKRGGTYLLLYSGGAYNGPYGGGYATSTSPTGPFAKAAENPFLREANPVLSVGGATVATGPRGGDWLIYHGREGGYGNPRQLRIDPVRYPSATPSPWTGRRARPRRRSRSGRQASNSRPCRATGSGRLGEYSGNSRSAPQRLHTWSWIGTRLAQSGQWRRGTSRSLRESSAARVPRKGRKKPIRNQSTNDDPLIFPIAPAERPKKKRITSSSTPPAPLP